MEGDRSDEENQDDQKTNKNNATKKPINRKQSRTLSQGSDDFEEVREPPKRDPRVV